MVALVKPQFEAGRAEVGKGGIVSDAAVQARVVRRIADLAQSLRFAVRGETESPVTGTEGNREFLLHLQWPGANHDA